MLQTHTHTHNPFLDHLDLKAEFERLVVYRCQSARARCRREKGVLKIDYSGPINQSTWVSLDAATAVSRATAPVALERMDAALTLPQSGNITVCDSWQQGTPPSAIIVRQDQYDNSMVFCALLADRGILRLTFLQSQEDHAMRFARLYQS